MHHRQAGIAPEQPSGGTPPEVLEQMEVFPFRRYLDSASPAAPGPKGSAKLQGDHIPLVQASARLPASAATLLPQAELGTPQLYRSTSSSTTSTSSTTSAREQGRTCSICLCPYAQGEGVGRLPCQHAFHAACIKDWLALKQSW